MWKTSCFSFLSKICVFLVHLEMAFVIFSEWAWYFYLPNFNNFKWNSAFTSTDLLLQTHSFWGVYGTSLVGDVGPIVFWVIGQLYGSSQQSDQIMVVTTPPVQAVSSSIGNYGNHNSNYQLGVVVKIGVVFPLSKEQRAFWGADILCSHAARSVGQRAMMLHPTRSMGQEGRLLHPLALAAEGWWGSFICGSRSSTDVEFAFDFP